MLNEQYVNVKNMQIFVPALSIVVPTKVLVTSDTYGTGNPSVGSQLDRYVTVATIFYLSVNTYTPDVGIRF